MAIAILAIVAARPSPIRADPSASTIAGAKSLVADGRRLRAAGDIVGARDRFQSAYLLVPTPIIGLDLGHARESLGELIEARALLLEAAVLPPIQNESAESIGARVEATRLANDLEQRIPTLTLTIEGIEGGAMLTVTVDAQEVPVASLGAPRAVNPGKHAVVARLGDRVEHAEVELLERETKNASIVFAPLPAPKPPKLVVVPPPPPRRESPPAPTHYSALTYVGFSVAGAGLIVGSVTGILSLKKANAFATACQEYDFQCPSSLQGDYDSSRRYGNVSTVSFLVGGAGLALGVYGLLTGESTPSPPPVALSLGVGAVGVQGRF